MTLETNRVTILVPDNGVYLDQGSINDLDLSSCGIPEGVRALDWRDGKGEIHFLDTTKLHEQITELPNWAINCVNKFEEVYLAEQARIAELMNGGQP